MKTLNLFFISTFLLISGAFAQTARVQVIHNSADTAAAVVDVWLDNVNTLDDFEFRESTAFLTLPSNTPIVITVQPSNSIDTTNALFQTTVNLDSNETYIVVANGIVSATGYSNPQPFGLDIYPIARETSAGGATSADVLVMHGATDAPAVDVYETSVPAGRLVDNLSYGDFTSYIPLPVNDFVIDVRDSVNSKIVASYSAPLATLNAGGLALTVIASGFLDSTQNSNGRAFGLFVATPAGGALIPLPEVPIPTAKVQVIHNSADLAAEFVDVWLNDGVLIDNFEFRTASPYVNAQAGVPFVISVSDSSSTDTTTALAQYTFTLDADSSYVIVANGIVSPTGYSPSQPFNLDVFPSARDTAIGGATTVDLLVNHGSTDAPTVDVVETSVPAGTIIDDLSYSDFAGYLSLGVADYTIEVRNETNSSIVAAYSAPLATLNAGGLSLTVVASGFLDSTQNSNGPSFGLFAATPAGGALIELPQVAIPTARVQVIHNSADLAAEFVDVWLNDGILVDNFEFRTASPFIDAQAGVPFVISISDSSSTDSTTALAQFTFNLEADSSYIVIANGIVSASGYSPATPFDLDVFVGAKEVSSGATNTEVLVYHGATDAPAVDVLETSVPAGLIVDSISYSEFQGYLNLATADYELQIQVASNSNVVADYSAPLNTLNLGGEAITVLASGFLDPNTNSNGPAFGLWAVTSNGGMLLPLPLITGLAKVDKQMEAAISVYPNPSQGLFNIEFTSIDNKPEIIEVFDFNGRSIHELKVGSSSFQSVDLSGLSKGIYFLRMSNNDNFAIKKIILQ